MYRADGRFRWALGVPQVEQVDWSTWAHVVGCGTRVSHAVLDALQVPRPKQIVLEVHRELSYLPGPIPRLQGRVVVVDDVHEGETSQRLARLYDADVVAVGTNGSTARLVAGLLPVLAVPEGPAVDTLNDHGRSEAGKH